MENLQWHPAFQGAAELEFKDDLEHLTLEYEHPLSKKPIVMDLLLIKKDPPVEVKNEIGKLFKEHNIVEYKGVGDELSIDVFHKGLAYASMYKSLGKHVDSIPMEQVTLTFFRAAYPEALFKKLKALGFKIEEPFPGIYYLKGRILFDTQVVVTSKLSRDHLPLRVLRDNADREDIRNFLRYSKLIKDPGERNNIGAILAVSIKANSTAYEEIKKEADDMSDALRELMKDEIQEELDKKEAEVTEKVTSGTRLDDIKKLMENLKLTAEKAMQALGLSEEEQKKYGAMIKA